MTTGITTFGTKDRKTAKIPPLPANVYELTIAAQKWSTEVAKEPKPGSAPYVKGYMEVTPENGTKRRIYTNFFTSLVPSKKDGAAMVDRANGITALTKATGVPLEEAQVLTKTFTSTEGTEETVEFVDPKAVASYLDSLAGTTVRAKVGIEGAEDDEYGQKNVVKSFLLPVAS